jgi:hypothetical protein
VASESCLNESNLRRFDLGFLHIQNDITETRLSDLNTVKSLSVFLWQTTNLNIKLKKKLQMEHFSLR